MPLGGPDPAKICILSHVAYSGNVPGFILATWACRVIHCLHPYL